MFRPRTPARVLAPFFLFAGCTSVPELPPVTEVHPSHPDAQSALIADRPTILDAMATDAVVEPEAGMETMDHSQHQMDMGDEGNDPPDAADAEETDHSHHMMNMGSEQEEPSAEDDAEDDNGHSEHGGDDDS